MSPVGQPFLCVVTCLRGGWLQHASGPDCAPSPLPAVGHSSSQGLQARPLERLSQQGCGPPGGCVSLQALGCVSLQALRSTCQPWSHPKPSPPRLQLLAAPAPPPLPPSLRSWDSQSLEWECLAFSGQKGYFPLSLTALCFNDFGSRPKLDQSLCVGRTLEQDSEFSGGRREVSEAWSWRAGDPLE